MRGRAFQRMALAVALALPRRSRPGAAGRGAEPPGSRPSTLTATRRREPSSEPYARKNPKDADAALYLGKIVALSEEARSGRRMAGEGGGPGAGPLGLLRLAGPRLRRAGDSGERLRQARARQKDQGRSGRRRWRSIPTTSTPAAT